MSYTPEINVFRRYDWLYSLVTTTNNTATLFTTPDASRELADALGAPSQGEGVLTHGELVAFVNLLATIKYGCGGQGELPYVGSFSEFMPYSMSSMLPIDNGKIEICNEIDLGYVSSTTKRYMHALKLGELVCRHPQEFVILMDAIKAIRILIRNQYEFMPLHERYPGRIASVASSMMMHGETRGHSAFDFVNTLISSKRVGGNIVLNTGAVDPTNVSVTFECGANPPVMPDLAKKLVASSIDSLVANKRALHAHIERLGQDLAEERLKIENAAFRNAFSIVSKAIQNGWRLESDSGYQYVVYPDKIFVERVLYQGTVIPLPEELRELLWVEDIRIQLSSRDLRGHVNTARGFHPHRGGGYPEDNFQPYREYEETANMNHICIGDFNGKPIDHFVLIPEAFKTVSYSTMFGNFPATLIGFWLGSVPEMPEYYKELRDSDEYDDDDEDRYDDDESFVHYDDFGLGKFVSDDYAGILMRIMNGDESCEEGLGNVYSSKDGRVKSDAR